MMIEQGLEKGAVPRLDLGKENAIQEFLVHAAQRGLLVSAHDLSEGGLAVALAESSFAKKIGVVIDHLDLIPLASGGGEGLRQDALYFGETQSRVIVSARPQDKEALIQAAGRHGVPVTQIGKTGGDKLVMGDRIQMEVAEALEIYNRAIPGRMS